MVRDKLMTRILKSDFEKIAQILKKFIMLLTVLTNFHN